MKYLEQYLTAENGSRFLEVVCKLEKEIGDKKIRLDTAKAKKIVGSLDDGKSVDDVVAELKKWCERIEFTPNDLLNNPNQLAGISGEELYNYLVEKGYDVKPLSRGKLKGIPFKEGGGFKINWGGNRILQYHPENYSHPTSAYYKISSGETGTIRISLKGNIID